MKIEEGSLVLIRTSDREFDGAEGIVSGIMGRIVYVNINLDEPEQLVDDWMDNDIWPFDIEELTLLER